MTETPEIVFENEDFVGINKPAGWLSVPAREPKVGDRVVSLWLREGPIGAAFIIHRLDRFTSGVMLIAKNDRAHRQGNLWFEKRIAKKIYHFLASPPPSRPAIQIKTPVDGKPAQTLFEVIETHHDSFYGRATPLTGRFHQIRDHASEAGFPLLGDSTFKGKPAHRVCLHAYSLEVPIGKIEVPFAPDLVTLWSQLKNGK